MSQKNRNRHAVRAATHQVAPASITQQDTPAAPAAAPAVATTATDTQAPPPAAAAFGLKPLRRGNVAIRYIGPKAEHEDTIADTGIVWTPDSVHLVTLEQAALLLFYPTCWEDARPKDDIAKRPITPKDRPNQRYMEESEEVREYPPMLHLANLGKVELIQYGIRHLGQRFDDQLSEPELRDKINRITSANARFEYA